MGVEAVQGGGFTLYVGDKYSVYRERDKVIDGRLAHDLVCTIVTKARTKIRYSNYSARVFFSLLICDHTFGTMEY
jgi:hypothetical protein